MSRLAVRSAVEAELQAFLNAQIPPVPLIPTINRQQPRPADDLWVSVEYFADYNDPLCMSGPKRTENGTVDVTVFARAGGGHTPAVQLADAIEDHFYGRDLQDDIQIIDTVPASEDTAGDGVPWYGVTVSLQYQHYIA